MNSPIVIWVMCYHPNNSFFFPFIKTFSAFYKDIGIMRQHFVIHKKYTSSDLTPKNSSDCLKLLLSRSWCLVMSGAMANLLSVALYLYQTSHFRRPWTCLFTSPCTASLITANTSEQVKVFHVYFGNTHASLWPTERSQMVSFVSLFLNLHHHMFSFQQDFEIPNVRPPLAEKKTHTKKNIFIVMNLHEQSHEQSAQK